MRQAKSKVKGELMSETKKVFRVYITETLEKELFIRAGSEEMATMIVRGLHNKEKIVLDSSNFIGVDFLAEELKENDYSESDIYHIEEVTYDSH